MNRLLSVCAVAGLLLAAAGAATPAAAQEMVPRAQFSGGYQLLAFRSGVDETFARGWYADVTGNVTRNVGLVAQVGGNFKTISVPSPTGEPTVGPADIDAWGFLGGVRLTSRRYPRFFPFGQALIGGMHGSTTVSTAVPGTGHMFFAGATNESPSTDFAMQLGGGVNAFVTEQVGLRVGADYVRIFSHGDRLNVVRFGLGFVFGF